MQIVHGTWIPDDTSDFLQRGAFYLWVETDTPSGATRRRDSHLHPRHLMQTALATFLREHLQVPELYPGTLARNFHLKSLLLPTVADRPAPSFELLRYMEEEEPPDVVLAPWQIWCYRVPALLSSLNTFFLLALQHAEDYQLGADLVFWYQLAQTIVGLIAKDQYIPALKYRALPTPPPRNRREKASPHFEIHPAWELLSATYETAIERFGAAMPDVCAAGMTNPKETALFDKPALLRHFAECLLHGVVTGTPFTAKFDQQIADTLLSRCLHPSQSASTLSEPDALKEYHQWQTWRTNFTRAETQAAFTLCFRLEEAPTPNDPWHLHFLVTSRQDPSLKLSLDEYWHLKPQARAAAARPFGQDFETQVLLALGYAARIYPAIWQGMTTDHPAGCRLTLEEAFTFLKEYAWVLGDAGYTVMVPAWWTPDGRRRAKVRLKTARRAPQGAAATAQNYFSLETIIAYDYQLSIGGQVVSEEEWCQLVTAKTPLVQFRGQWMELDREKMQQLLQFWQAHQQDQHEFTFQDLLKRGTETEDDLEWEHDQSLLEVLARLREKQALAPVVDPSALQGKLRDYQKRGVAWLVFLEQLGLHPCLADDMGLGKTLEVIACLLKEREEASDLPPTLVIAPTSVLGNWRKELERFAPTLRVLVHQGSTRIKDPRAFSERCQAHDVVLISFALARLDDKLLHSLTWHRVVVDEAQNIKNPQAAQTRAILKLAATHRLALTGTPVENRLRDLWSIFNFLNPGYLGKEPHFRRQFEVPLAISHDPARSALLKKLVEPFILRRVKTDKSIIDNLPDKVEQKVYCTLSSEQASLYEAVVKEVTDHLNEAEGIQRKGLILSTLLKLKQICNHPAQFLQDGSAFTAERSLKLQRLLEMLEEVLASGESALIFTQFTEIGGALERHLTRHLHYPTYYLHGGTPANRRDQMVTAFQDPETEPSVFLLSLRAGGVGLNLTKANHVFHFDRWWNPAVEDQATDRAFRIGQRRNVFVHKFVALGTLEERIDAMIEDKKRLSSLVVETDESWLTELDNDTFKALITLRRSAVLE
jgi:SNF2 family DNA or RNA helicase